MISGPRFGFATKWLKQKGVNAVHAKQGLFKDGAIGLLPEKVKYGRNGLKIKPNC